MGYIKYNNESLNFSLEDVIFIKTFDCMEFLYNLLNKKFQIYDQLDILSSKNFIITPLTKTNELLQFTKTNLLGNHINNWNNENKNNFNIIDVNFLNTLKNTISEYIDNVEINLDIDILKLINLIFDWENEHLITKKEFICFIKLFNTKFYDSKVLLFNIDWIDEEIINLLENNKIKTIIVFNNCNNIKKLLKQNQDKIIINKNEKFYFYDYKKNITEEYENNSSQEFIFL